MEVLIPFIKVLHIFISIILILIILLQPSKSGDLGSMFGGGSSDSVFGSSGAVPFLAKLTRLLAVVFVCTSLFLGYFSVKSISSSVVQDSPAEVEQKVDPDDPFAEEVQNDVTDAPETQPEQGEGLKIDVLSEPPQSETKE